MEHHHPFQDVPALNEGSLGALDDLISHLIKSFYQELCMYLVVHIQKTDRPVLLNVICSLDLW
uniref:Uncharacterized protein n=1 Tax=Arundo donax TaxID=35708 RepID=A0A0A9ATG3_ARUDO